MAPVLSYWNVRGLCAPINYLLEYVGEKYQYDGIEFDKAPEWFAKKETMGFDFPNLPYYIDGDVKLTQSTAILRYLGRKHNLIAKNEKDLEMQDMAEGVTGDLMLGWAFLMYGAQDFEQDKMKYKEERLTPILKHLEKHLGSRKYLVGDYITYIDFSLFERLDGHSILFPGLLDSFSNLKKYHDQMGNLKGVKEYRSSDRFNKSLNGPMAKWSNK